MLLFLASFVPLIKWNNISAKHYTRMFSLSASLKSIHLKVKIPSSQLSVFRSNVIVQKGASDLVGLCNWEA